MKYVLSDVHGEYDKFSKMLKLINFSESDTLYVLGDVLDRGINSLDVMDIIMNADNIHMIKGNHEEMFLDYYRCLSHERVFDNLWLSNGGNMVKRELRNRDGDYLKHLISYISNLPSCLIVDNFILAHAGIYVPPLHESLTVEEITFIQTDDTLLWDRSFIDGDTSIDEFTVVVGHTPVQTMTGDITDVRIIKKEGKILIDCGATFEDYGGRLACLRLDDMKEFYV